MQLWVANTLFVLDVRPRHNNVADHVTMYQDAKALLLVTD
jgi:hypothetical protein